MMAGLLKVITATQKPRVHQYVQELLDRAEVLHGKESGAYQGIYNQYFRMPTKEPGAAQSTRHYNALGDLPEGLERLYRRVVVVDLLSACSSECVFCIRGLYNPHTLSDVEISDIIDYLARDEYLTEVLITGGDPLVAPKKLGGLISGIATGAPNIQVVRIGTRLPVQNPSTFGDDTYDIFRCHSDRFLFQIQIQINHPFELQPESIEVIERLTDCGVRLYSQNVLLKDVNDDIDTLIDLYDRLESLKVIPHYLFHAVPIVGTDEFRTSVARGLELARQLTASGYLSGLSKPMFTLMTAVGKVTLYEGSILSNRDGILTIRTSYRLEDRLRWNPGYQLPESATVNELGTLDVQYVDGVD
jgi:lysine 2,3-aminomutase